MDLAVVFAVALVAGTVGGVGGVVGTGASIILMPVLVLRFGPVAAVPVMAIAALLGNVGRVVAWRREVAWRPAAAYCLTAVPCAGTGPLTIPIFAAAGLERGGLLGTESLASVAVYATKIATFRGFGALPPDVLASGLLAGTAMLAGSFIGRHVVLRIAPSAFRLLIDALMLVSGLTLLWAAMR